MQKKLIAVAVAGLMSGAAFAQTTVTIGGKFDAGYQFKHTMNADGTGVAGTGPVGTPQGGKTTETQGDGGGATTRVTVQAREEISPSIKAGVDYDIRFGNVHEGKTGLTSNDKKAMFLTVPGVTFQFGVANLMSDDYKLAEKPYMVAPKDWEGVKTGISRYREESLTNRNTSFWTAPLSVGPFSIIAKGTFAGGDNRKSGNNNDGASTTPATSAADNSKKSGDVYVVGTEWKIGDIANGGFDGTHRRNSDVGNSGTMVAGLNTAENGMIFTHSYISVKPIAGLKIGANWNTYKGRAAGVAFQEKNTNLVVNYVIGNLGLGVGISHLNDVGGDTTKNNGRQIMLGAFYQLSKSTSIYAGYSKTDFDNNTGTVGVVGGKYQGTGTNFITNGGAKVDEKYTRIGILKDF